MVETLHATVETTLRIPPHESAFVANRLLVYLTSCDERRLGQWEHTTWWNFLRAETMSEDYRHLLVVGPTRNLAAVKAEVASTHTLAHMAEAFLYTAMGRGNDGALDRLLDGPTNEAWIDPWVEHLIHLGVRFRVGPSVREEVTREMWAQLKAALEDTGERVLPDELLHSSFLDSGVTGIGEGRAHNDDPLLIHPVGTWQKRPAAVTAIPNFFLAADYVRNDLDLATMEGANEAARSAVTASWRPPGRASRAAASTPSTGRRSSSRSRHRTRSTTGSACRTCSTSSPHAEQVCHDPPVSADELVAIYDSTGVEIGSATRSVMRADGLWHSCASVLVLSGDRKRVYVHRRVEDKDIFPGAHDCWAGGVMAPGERPEDCARRELAEELGIIGVAIEPLFTMRFPDPPLRSHTYSYQTCWDEPIVHQPEEIAAGWWMSIDELRAKLADPDWPFVPDDRALIQEWLRRYH